MFNFSDPQNPYVLTGTGRKIFVLNPRPDDIDLMDIGIPLTREPRYAGHSRFPFSVAQHSLVVAGLVSFRCEREGLGFNPHIHLQALLHDATEAYLKDIPKPVKLTMQLMMPEGQKSPYDILEERWNAAIMQHFGLESNHHVFVKDADLMACAAEKRDIMPYDATPWEGISDLNPSESLVTQRKKEEDVLETFISTARLLLFAIEGIKKRELEGEKPSENSLH